MQHTLGWVALLFVAQYIYSTAISIESKRYRASTDPSSISDETLLQQKTQQTVPKTPSSFINRLEKPPLLHSTNGLRRRSFLMLQVNPPLFSGKLHVQALHNVSLLTYRTN